MYLYYIEKTEPPYLYMNVATEENTISKPYQLLLVEMVDDE
jgi:hypothetical protein